MNINLNEYVDAVKEQFEKLDKKYETQITFSILSLACQLYNADHLNQNVTASIETRLEE